MPGSHLTGSALDAGLRAPTAAVPTCPCSEAGLPGTWGYRMSKSQHHRALPSPGVAGEVSHPLGSNQKQVLKFLNSEEGRPAARAHGAAPGPHSTGFLWEKHSQGTRGRPPCHAPAPRARPAPRQPRQQPAAQCLMNSAVKYSQPADLYYDSYFYHFSPVWRYTCDSKNSPRAPRGGQDRHGSSSADDIAGPAQASREAPAGLKGSETHEEVPCGEAASPPPSPAGGGSGEEWEGL